MAIRFIRDEASTTDDFGGHERVSELVSELLHHPDKPRLIGILGSWGSGKTTVLKLANKKLLEKNPEAPPIIFTFDAWMHQSDPPRRAFIEALVDFLIREKLGDQSTWQPELDEVQKRVERHDITNTPFISPWALAIALALLLLPLGVRLSTESGWRFWGWAIIVSPFLLAVANWWAWRRHRWPFPLKTFFSKRNFTTNRRPYRDRSIASIFVSKSTDKTTNTILKTPEPTSIEFRRTFVSLLSKLRPGCGKVVFVLDNLDRISPEDAFTIWSTFRSLFADAKDLAEETGIDFMVVIPIDFHSLKRIYDKALSDDNTASDGVQSLIEKSFDVVLRVPPPVQSDWMDYLIEKLMIVNSDLDPAHAHDGATIFGSSLEHLGQSTRITPRQINNFANRVGSETAIADKSVSVHSIFYYAAFGRVSESYDIKSIVTLEAPGARIIGRMDADWRAGVAALHFGVSRDKALQILIGDEILETINKEHQDRFSELTQLPGFSLVLSNLVRDSAARGPSFFAALAGLLPDTFGTDVASKEIWKLLAETIPLEGGWDRLSSFTEKGIGRLARQGDEALLGRLISSLCSADQPAVPSSQMWLTHIEALLGASSPENLLDDLKRIAVPGEPGFYLDVLEAANGDSLDGQLIKVLRPRAETDRVLGATIVKLDDGEFSDEAASLVAKLLTVDARWSWATFADEIRDRVRDTDDYDLAIRALRLLQTIPGSASSLGELGRSGTLADLFHGAWGNQDDAELASILQAISANWPELDISDHVGESDEGVGILTTLDSQDEHSLAVFNRSVETAIQNDSPRVALGLLKWAESFPSSQQTIHRALGNAFENQKVGRLRTEDSMPYLVRLAKQSSRPSQQIIRRVSGWGTFWSVLASKYEISDVAAVLNKSGTWSVDDKDALALQGAFAKLDESFWLNAIRNDPAILRALDSLLLAHDFVRVGPALANAHERYVSEGVSANLSLILMGVNWHRLLASSEPNAVERSIHQALELAERGDMASKERVLESLDDGLLSSAAALKESTAVVSHVVLPILLGDSSSALETMVKRSASLAPIVKRARGRNRSEIISRIEALHDGGALDDDQAAQLRSAWSLKRPSLRAT